MKTFKDIIEKAEKEFEEKYTCFQLCEVVNKKDFDRLSTFFSSQIRQAVKEAFEATMPEI